MPRRPLIALSSGLEVAAAIAAVYYLLQYLVLAGFRLPYPYELEWMEGAVVDHVRRLLSGQPLFVEPSFEFTSFIYPPFYYYLSAAVSKVTGIGFLPLRLVSFLASLGCFALIFETARRETGRFYYGLVSAGLFAATFEIGGAWLDVARVDTLFVFLTVASAFALRFFGHGAGAAASGVLLALGALTKQPALIAVVPLGLYCLYARGKRDAGLFLGGFVLVFGGATAFWYAGSDGWYGYYIFGLPRQHQFFAVMLPLFWTRDIFAALPVAFLLLALYFAVRFRGWRKLTVERRERLFFQAAFLGSMLGAGWFSRLHFGGHTNVVIPAYAAMAMFFGAALCRPLPRDREPARFRLLISGAALFQLLWLVYNPAIYFPRKEDVRAGDAYVRVLSSIRGDVYTPDHGYVPTLAGKKTHPHIAVLWDVMRADDNQIKRKLEGEIKAAFREKRFAAVVIHAPALTFPWIMDEVNAHYRPRGVLFRGRRVFGQINTNQLYVKMNPQLYAPR
jgi:4-amino-4-deoxy-L-arabinose transferase-like glycosyltransferase